jgi:hypothetical protein
MVGQKISVLQGRGTCSGGLPGLLGKNRGVQARRPSGRAEKTGKVPNIKGNRKTLFILKGLCQDINIYLKVYNNK